LPPNPAVNTDTPHARLRPRTGSPVTFVRYALHHHQSSKEICS
jgi:hypothetical protein